MERRCLLVTLGTATLAVPLYQLTGVEPVARLVPLPRVPAWVLGATHRQGAVLSVIDLAALLGQDDATVDLSGARLLVAADDDLGVAFAVAGITETRTFDDGQIEPVAGEFDGRLACVLTGTITDGEQRIGLLDLPAVLRVPEFALA